MSQQKVALVTGVSSGIGRAIAGLLSRHGFRVFGTARGTGGAKRALENVELVQVDVRDEESVHCCVRTVLDRTGRIDALVNNAGYTLIGSLEETTIEEAKQLFDTNFFGVLLMTQAVLRFMRDQRSGRIVNIGSLVGFVPAPY
jgi:NAD(P)-dependent dehydrogenase (short-subunit alcohol dehydrogenase family)